MDHFLLFWSEHNLVIIEALIAAIIFSVAILSYRMIFATKEAEASGHSLGGDTSQIEEVLQKILDNQSKQTSALNFVDGAGATASGEPADPTSVAAATAPLRQEITQLKSTIKEKESEVESLRTQLAVSGDVPASGGGFSLEEKTALENKIKDLEARLAEYEIISEDIADLSKYKEENANLLKQIADLQSAGAAAAPVASAPAPKPAPAAEPPVVAPAAPAPAPAESVDASNVVDDDLMKEFAAAVENQKAAPVTEGTDQLMNDFESFVKKS